MSDENLELYTLVWLDTSSNSSDVKLRLLNEVRSSINFLKFFNDQYECENCLRSLSDDERIVMIINDQIAKDFLPQIIHLKQISSIYILKFNSNQSFQWINEYSQIKSIKKDLNEIVSQISIEQIQLNRYRSEEPFAMNIFHSKKTNDQFVCSQFLFKSLLQLKIFLQDKNQFLKLCEKNYRGNEKELVLIKEFRRKYSSFQSLWWLTRDSFLSRIIEKSLRREDYQLLFLSRFFLQDIFRELEKLQSIKSLLVYRTFLLTNEQFQFLQNSIGNCLSINSFLFTNLNRKQAISNVKPSKDFHRILFEINADHKLKGILPFANITSHTYYKGEQQILFFPSSIFKIIQINEQNPQLILIRISLTSSLQEEQLEKIPSFDLFSFGQLLIDQRRFEQSQIFFKHFLNHLPFDHPQISQCYDALANISFELNEYQLTLKYFKKCLQIKKETSNDQDPTLPFLYNRLAYVYMTNGEFTKALQSYQMAWKIFEEKFGENDIRLVDCLNNIARLFKNQNNYEKALQFYLKTLAIEQNSSSSSLNSSDLARSFTNLGITYIHLKQYDQALQSYNQALNIYLNILPKPHSLISMIYENLANIYSDQNQFSQARLFYQKAYDLYQQLVPSNHPDVLQIQMIIKRIESKLKYS